MVCVLLVEGVDAHGGDGGEGAQAGRRDVGVEGRFRSEGAEIAVAEGVAAGLAVRIEANVVDGPAIDGDGLDAFGGESGAFAEAFVYAGVDGFKAPIQTFADLPGGVGEAVNEGDLGFVAGPAEERDATAFGAEIDGDESLAGCSDRSSFH